MANIHVKILLFSSSGSHEKLKLVAKTWQMAKTGSRHLLISACRKFWEYSEWTKLATMTTGRAGREQTKFKIDRHSKDKMGKAWPHIEKAKQQHYKIRLDVEPSGQDKD